MHHETKKYCDKFLRIFTQIIGVATLVSGIYFDDNLPTVESFCSFDSPSPSIISYFKNPLIKERAINNKGFYFNKTWICLEKKTRTQTIILNGNEYTIGSEPQ